MTETITLDKELRVGPGWRYQCKSCGHKVGLDVAYPKECPGCHAGGWWGSLVAPGISQNGVKKDGATVKTTDIKALGGVKTRDLILSQLPDAVECCQRQDKGVCDTTLGRGRGRPRQAVPDDLILELSVHGLSSRKIVDELARRGIPGKGYKVIQRKLKALSRGDAS